MQKEHFEILLQSMDSKFNLVLEGFSVLNKKIDDESDARREDTALLNVKISALTNRFDAVDIRLDNIEERLDTMNGELTSHRNNTELHRAPSKRGIKKVA